MSWPKVHNYLRYRLTLSGKNNAASLRFHGSRRHDRPAFLCILLFFTYIKALSSVHNSQLPPHTRQNSATYKAASPLLHGRPRRQIDNSLGPRRKVLVRGLNCATGILRVKHAQHLSPHCKKLYTFKGERAASQHIRPDARPLAHVVHPHTHPLCICSVRYRHTFILPIPSRSCL